MEEDDEILEDLEDEDLEIIKDLTDSYLFSSTEASAYVEDQIQAGDHWYASIGLRGSSFFNEGQKYFNIEPRLTLRYQHTPKLSIYTSASQMVQYLHLVTNAALRLPNDLWVLSDKDVLPSKSIQGELGVAWQADLKLMFNLDLYYKKMSNLLTYLDSERFLDDIDIENPNTFLTSGAGESYGAEFFMKYSSEKAEAGLSYVLSWSNRRYEDQNLGLSYPHEYDQRHRFKLFYYQKIGKHFLFGANWVYNSPNPQWRLVNIDLDIEEESQDINPLGQKNRRRSIAYHRLDFSFAFRHQGPRVGHLFKLGVYNAANRRNAIFYDQYFEANESLTEPVEGFPFLPSLSYQIKF